jgi:pterin-4a-carbinolamine dehydratase
MKSLLTTVLPHLFLTRIMDHTNAASAAAAVATQGFCAAATTSDADAVVTATTATAATTTSCVPCASLDPSHLLSVEVIRDRIQRELSPWWSLRTKVVERREEEEEEEERDGDHNNVTIKIESMLYRKLTAKHFQAALDAINAMGRIAEMQNHHPNFHLTNYRDVEVEIYTHKIGGTAAAVQQSDPTNNHASMMTRPSNRNRTRHVDK